MPEILSQCPLCKDDRSTLFDQREFRGYMVTNRLCSNCGLVYQSPRKSEAELREFYLGEYRRIYQGDEGPTQKDITVQVARAGVIFDLLLDNGVEHINHYLDIGSSTGLLLEKIKQEFHCQVTGIEPGNAYREYAISKGLEVFESLEAMTASGERKFDLITMMHVLEHIPDPVDYLHRLRSDLMTEQGKLLVEVPNLYAHDSFEVAHLTCFSRHSLVELLGKAGFKTIFLDAHGRPRSNMIPLYISLLAAPEMIEQDQRQIDNERWVRIKRNAGLTHRKVIEKLFPRQAWLPEFRS
jgi:SAM-dependent methyltransferase